MLEEIRTRLAEPTARGLARAVGRAVGDGALPAGARLPPIRTVAEQLALSPTTVSAAWSLLLRSGTIRTDGRRGTSIADRPGGGPRRYRRALEPGHGFELDLSTGVPDAALLPDLAPALRRLQAASVPETYLDEPVVPELEELLRQDWPFPAGGLTITDGAMDALDLLITCFVRFGERVAVENPCFPPLLDRLEGAGVEVVPVDLDDDGPLPGSVRAAADAGVKALFLQPRAQNPTGAAVTPERAAAVAAELDGTDVLVVENDSSGSVAASALVSLGTALPARTVHIRSFAKSHGPDLRLAAVAGPAEIVDQLVERRRLGQGWTSRMLQRVLLDLLSRPASIAQVDRARSTYAQRRARLVAALGPHGVRVGGKDGLNLWLPVADESAALVGLASRGIGVAPGAPFLARADSAAHVRVTCGLLADGHERVAAELAAAAGRLAFTGHR